MVTKFLNSGKTVLISGAAGGLGSVLVKMFAEDGFHVIVTDIDSQGLAKFNSQENIQAKTVDITNPEQVSSFIKDVDLDGKGLDLLICLAGIYDSFPVTEADPELFKKMMEVNLMGTAILVQGLLNPLVKNCGRVIVVSSESYKIQAMFQPYMITKSALEAWCRVAWQELSLKGVKLVVIRPGAIKTPLLNWMENPGNHEKYPAFSKELKRSREQSVKMVGKIVTPEAVARKILKVSTTLKPKRIYRINNSFMLKIISLLPPGMFDRLVVRRFNRKGSGRI
jgi:2,3-dihydro-2,3-dihydroxybenzoate dehydrogenase